MSFKHSVNTIRDTNGVGDFFTLPLPRGAYPAKVGISKALAVVKTVCKAGIKLNILEATLDLVWSYS